MNSFSTTIIGHNIDPSTSRDEGHTNCRCAKSPWHDFQPYEFDDLKL